MSDHLLVGFSGGPDSVYLLHVLCQLGYPITAMHVNHKMRPEADEEVRLVERLAASLGPDFISSTVDVPAYAHEVSISIEEAARTLRYRLLFEQARSLKAKAVLVAHTADDQAETILLHLLRGSGLAGLRGMEVYTLPNPWSEAIPLVRPLLTTWRADIQKYLAEHGLQALTDRSNLDVSFLRNRIRHELLPVLETYNPSIREGLIRMGESLKDDYAVLQQLVDRAWESILLQQDHGYIALRMAGFMELPLAIQRHLLRKAIAYHLPSLRDVSFDTIDRALMLLSGDMPGNQTDLIAGIRLVKDADAFWVLAKQIALPATGFPAISKGEKLHLTIPSTHDLSHGWQLQVEEILDPDVIRDQSHKNMDPFQAWLDVSEVSQPLIARSRGPGDYIRSLGMDGHSTKISDLMINLKLPRRARPSWPLICSGDEILWVPGYRLSHLVRVRPDTSKALHLTLSRRQVS